MEKQPKLEEILEASDEVLIDDADHALAELLILYLDFPAYPVSHGAIKACARAILADKNAIKNELKIALAKHDELATQGLIALEIVSLQKASGISYFQDELVELSKSPNIIIRMIATKILIHTSGQSIFPPRVSRSLPAIYSLHLPDIAPHKTEYSHEKASEPVLLRDPALALQPLDIEAREIAKKALVPESNLLYHTVEKLKDLEIQRTWLLNGLVLEPRELTLFLEKINLIVSHNKPKIFPCKHSLAHVAAELYDAEKLSFSDLGFIESIFGDYDPNLFFVEAIPRPNYVEKIGGLANDLGAYLDLPRDWDQTLETSLPLLKSRSAGGRIILAEWTHLKRLQRDWPSEERISLFRATAPYKVWDGVDINPDKLPFANVIGLHISDYFGILDYPAIDLVIAHNGYSYQMEKANWLGLNPRVGFDLGWQPVEDRLFSWKNKNNQLVAESVYWQDGNFDSNDWHEYSEVGYGWLVLVTEVGYQEMRRRYGAISRGGVIKRTIGQFGLKARKIISSELDTL